MIELKINNYIDRTRVLSALAENGYTVKLISKEQRDHYLTYDYFVVVVEEPDFPKYK